MRKTRRLAGILNTQAYFSFPQTSILSHFLETWQPSSFTFYFHIFERDFFTVGKTAGLWIINGKLTTDLVFRETISSGGASTRLENSYPL